MRPVKRVGELIFESPERRAHNLLMFCRVITAQVDYIIALVFINDDKYLLWMWKLLYRSVASVPH